MATITERLQSGIKTISLETAKGALYGYATGNFSHNLIKLTSIFEAVKGTSIDVLAPKPAFIHAYSIWEDETSFTALQIDGSYLPYLGAASGAFLGSLYGVTKAVFGERAQSNDIQIRVLSSIPKGAVCGAYLGFLSSLLVRACTSVEDHGYKASFILGNRYAFEIMEDKTLKERILDILFRDTFTLKNQYLPIVMAGGGVVASIWCEAAREAYNLYQKGLPS